MGDRMIALERFVSLKVRSASALATSAFALASSARATAAAASPASISCFEGTLPPVSSRAFMSCASLLAASLMSACARCTFARAASTAAFACRTCARSFDVSSSASTCPAFTWSLKSTRTFSIVPETSTPTSTLLIGSSVPVAVTVTVRFPRVTSWLL